jgi:hypothetical protein
MTEKTEIMTDGEIYDMMTNYQSPNLFLEGLENWSELTDYVINYVYDMKHEMLPRTTMDTHQIADAMIRYLVEQRAYGELEDFPPPFLPTHFTDDGEMVLWFIERLRKFRIWRKMKVVFEVDDYWVNGLIHIDYQYLTESNQIEFTFVCKFYYPEEYHRHEANKKYSPFYDYIDREFHNYLDRKFPFLNIYPIPRGDWRDWNGYDKEEEEVIMKFHTLAECEIKNES